MCDFQVIIFKENKYFYVRIHFGWIKSCHDKSAPPLHATSFLSCFNHCQILFLLISYIQKQKCMYDVLSITSISCKIRISLDCFTKASFCCMTLTASLSLSLTCLSSLLLIGVLRNQPQSWPLSPTKQA